MKKARFSIKLFICISVFLLNLFDAIATHIGIKYYGAIELSPLMSYLMEKGFIYFYISKGFICILFCIMIIKYWNRYKVAIYGGYLVFIIYFILGVYHITNILLI